MALCGVGICHVTWTCSRAEASVAFLDGARGVVEEDQRCFWFAVRCGDLRHRRGVMRRRDVSFIWGRGRGLMSRAWAILKRSKAGLIEETGAQSRCYCTGVVL